MNQINACLGTWESCKLISQFDIHFIRHWTKQQKQKCRTCVWPFKAAASYPMIMYFGDGIWRWNSHDRSHDGAMKTPFILCVWCTLKKGRCIIGTSALTFFLTKRCRTLWPLHSPTILSESWPLLHLFQNWASTLPVNLSFEQKFPQICPAMSGTELQTLVIRNWSLSCWSFLWENFAWPGVSNDTDLPMRNEVEWISVII